MFCMPVSPDASTNGSEYNLIFLSSFKESPAALVQRLEGLSAARGQLHCSRSLHRNARVQFQSNFNTAQNQPLPFHERKVADICSVLIDPQPVDGGAIAA